MDTSYKKVGTSNEALYVNNRGNYMSKVLEDKFLLTVIVAFCLISFQFSSVEVSAELNDDIVVITVDSTNLKFSPNEVTINEGQTVRFFWSGEFLDHNAVAINGIFNSGEPEKEVDYSFTFDKGTNDTYNFICEPHELLEMVGTITVTHLMMTTLLDLIQQVRLVLIKMICLHQVL